MLSAILLLLLVLAGLLFILGLRSAAKRLILAVILIIVLSVVFRAIINQLPSVSLDSDMVIIFIFFITFLVGIALIRFINRRRKLNSWLGTKTTSQKKRVERD